MIKWFGIIILAKRFEFGDRDSLCSDISKTTYSYAPGFGKTGMSRHLFLYAVGGCSMDPSDIHVI